MPRRLKEIIITVFGSSEPKEGSDAYKLAHDLGQSIAEADWTLCNGGYGGTMEASARGAASMNGEVIGVTCMRFRRSGPNRYITREWPTLDFPTRLQTLIRLGNAYVTLPGGTGSLLELAYAWELTNKGLLPRPRPIILLGDHWHPVIDCVRAYQSDATPILYANNVEEAMEHLQGHFSPDHYQPLTGDESL